MSMRALTFVLLALLLLGAGAWLLRDSPLLQRVLPALWPAEGSATDAHVLRKCRGASGITYTDDACPPGTRAEAVGGGTLSVLPAAPAAAVPSAAAASAQSPLRRLAGPDESAAQRERVLEQALSR